MRLVQHDEAPVPAVRPLEQVHVRGAQQQVLQHRVVGQQQVRRAVAHLGSGEQLVREPGLARVQGLEQGGALGGPLRCLPGVPAERDLGCAREHLPQPAHLVVGQGVHRVQQQRPDPWTQRPGVPLPDELGEDRQQEALRLARPGPGRDDEVAARGGFADRRFLVRVQRPVQRQRGPAEPGEPAGQDTVGDQPPQAGARRVRRCRLEQRPLGQQRAGVDRVPQRPRELRVAHRQQRPQVAAVRQAEVLGGGDHVHH